MHLVLLSDELRKNEFLALPLPDDCDLTYFDQLPAGSGLPRADLLIDLLFDNSNEHLEWLQQTGAGVILVDWPSPPSRRLLALNGWPGFLGKPTIEASALDAGDLQQPNAIMASIGRTIEWTNPSLGFTGQRIVASIIQEAFLTVEDGTATEQGVDTAMKLGTNYPYGPFEWANLIGYGKVMRVLDLLNAENAHYQPSILLKEKALAQ